MRGALLALFGALFLLCAAPAWAADQPLATAILEPSELLQPTAPLEFSRIKDAGASSVAFVLDWRAIATGGASPPDATDPASPSYTWAAYDQAVTEAVAAGLSPVLTIADPPLWARAFPAFGEASAPDPIELAKFATAAATRYSGTFLALPRVRYWEVWNEPNISLFFAPQFMSGSPFAPTLYREMVNRMADSVKAVAPDNLIIAGGTAPFFDNTPAVTAIDPDWGPLSFLRAFLCLGPDLRPNCPDTARFDIWATHPYTSGGPTHKASLPNDVSIANLPAMRVVLSAGVEAGHVISPNPPQFWATEFSWDSNPPDPNGVPEPLLTRWTSEALYRMWQSGVSLVTWFLLRDQPMDSSPYQSGLYFRGATVANDQPKPMLAAFRFPFVAFPNRNQLTVWGRTPDSQPASVAVQQQAADGGWNLLGTLLAGANGIFRGTLSSTVHGDVRANIAGNTSPAFSLAPVPDQIFNPFGLGVLEPPPPPPHRSALPPRTRPATGRPTRSALP